MTSRVLNTRNMQAKNAFENYINSDTKPDKTKLYWLLSVINVLAIYIVGKKAVTDFFTKKQLKSHIES